MNSVFDTYLRITSLVEGDLNVARMSHDVLVEFIERDCRTDAEDGLNWLATAEIGDDVHLFRNNNKPVVIVRVA